MTVVHWFANTMLCWACLGYTMGRGDAGHDQTDKLTTTQQCWFFVLVVLRSATSSKPLACCQWLMTCWDGGGHVALEHGNRCQASDELIPLKETEVSSYLTVSSCLLWDDFTPGSTKLTFQALQWHMQVMPPCHYIAETVQRLQYVLCWNSRWLCLLCQVL